ncbi:MAG: ribbon-helix-helix protein, CopG family [Acidobacteriia bacterium]|nr:ribbon-helix-helix protein, CopG family [Terriglobia bacterium]MYC66036.1 ribbon-helix-helix protein, CopG family [Terriglobia bacterium]
MRRVQFYIQESLDDVLQVEAAKRKRSKASLIRECVAARYGDSVQPDSDPLTALIGTVDIDPEDVGDATYGNETRRH